MLTAAGGGLATGEDWRRRALSLQHQHDIKTTFSITAGPMDAQTQLCPSWACYRAFCVLCAVGRAAF